MDMMGGVLEVKKEDILRMVRFLAVLVESGMRWREILKCDRFFFFSVNLSFRNSTNCYIWNGWAVGSYCTAQGTV